MLQVLHSVGLWSQRVGELWLVYQITGSGVSLGFAAALRTVPSLCMSPLAGVLADRYDRRRLLQISHSIKILLTATFWAVAKYSNPDIWALYGLIFLLGMIVTFDAPIRRGFVRVIVPDDLLLKAASLHTAVIFGRTNPWTSNWWASNRLVRYASLFSRKYRLRDSGFPIVIPHQANSIHRRNFFSCFKHLQSCSILRMAEQTNQSTANLPGNYLHYCIKY